MGIIAGIVIGAVLFGSCKSNGNRKPAAKVDGKILAIMMFLPLVMAWLRFKENRKKKKEKRNKIKY